MEPNQPMLPSRFQLGDEVRVQGVPGRVSAVTFTAGKVFYDVQARGQLIPRALSEHLSPGAPHLHVVPALTVPKD